MALDNRPVDGDLARGVPGKVNAAALLRQRMQRHCHPPSFSKSVTDLNDDVGWRLPYAQANGSLYVTDIRDGNRSEYHVSGIKSGQHLYVAEATDSIAIYHVVNSSKSGRRWLDRRSHREVRGHAFPYLT